MAEDQVWKDIQAGKGISKETPSSNGNTGTTTEQRNDNTIGTRTEKFGNKNRK